MSMECVHVHLHAHVNVHAHVMCINKHVDHETLAIHLGTLSGAQVNTNTHVHKGIHMLLCSVLV